ncbi:MAG: hypothetical protein ABI725_04390 [Chloroflexota bacterium]
MKTVALKDVVQRVETIDPRRNPDREITYIDISSVDNVKKVIARPTRLQGRDAPSRARQLVKTGDVLVGTTRPYLNAVAQVPAGLDGQICSTGFTVLRPSPQLLSDYLFHWVQHPVFVDGLTRLVQGALYPAVTDKQVLSQSIPLPSVDLQRRIAALLVARFATAENLRRAASTESEGIRATARTLVAATFADLKTPRRSLSQLVPGRGAITDGPFGSNLKTEHYVSSGVRVVRLANIGNGEFLDADRAYITQDHFRGLRRHSVGPSDVVVAALGDGIRPAGRACVVPDSIDEGLVKADCFRIRLADTALEPAFLMHFLNSPSTLRAVAGATRGATRPRMTLDMLKAMEIPVLERDTQRGVVAKLSEIMDTTRRAGLASRAIQEDLGAIAVAFLREAFAEPS